MRILWTVFVLFRGQGISEFFGEEWGDENVSLIVSR